MAKHDKQTTPRLRFQGFDGAWERKEFQEILNIRKEYVNPSFYDLDVELENLVSNSGVLIGDTSVRTQTNSFFQKGDILFGRLRPYLKKWWLADKDGVKSGEIWALETNSEHSNLFAYLIIQSEKFLEAANVTSGTKMPRADWGNLKEITFNLPSEIREQTQLGHFFRELDHRIAQSRALWEKSRQLKKAMLAKMFPAAGETSPKIRFKGFTGEWERKTLGEVVEIERKGKAQFQQLQAGNVPYLDAEFLNGGEKFLTDAIQDVNADDVLIIWDGSNAGKVYIGFNGVLGSTLKMYRTSLDCSPMFLYQELVRNEEVIFSQYRTPNIPHVIKDFSSEYHFLMPLYEEQIAIGNFFRQLDDTIALHALETEKLGRLKKALLAAMLV